MFRLYQPCIPVRSKVAPSGPQWVHEIKHDGYRLIVRRIGDRVRLITRGGYDLSKRYPLIAKAACALKVKSATLDGEAVVCGPDGVSDFEKLHSRKHDAHVILYAFDLLEVDGEDLRPLPLDQRKEGLARLLRRVPVGIHLVAHEGGDGRIMFEHACRVGLEGMCRSGETRASARDRARSGSRSRTRQARRCFDSMTKIGSGTVGQLQGDTACGVTPEVTRFPSPD